MNVVKSEGIHRNVTVAFANKHGMRLEEGDFPFVVPFFFPLICPPQTKGVSLLFL